ncbi:MAG: TolC family protein [bacterium]
MFCISSGIQSELIKPEREYDLQTSLTDGINNSNTLLYSKQEIMLNESRVKEARAILYPHFGINANVSQFTAQDVYALSPELGSTLLKPTGEQGDDFYAARMSLKKSIYTGGRELSTLRLAKASLERAKSHYQEIKNNIVFEINKGFYELLYYQQLERIFKEVLSQFESEKETDKKKYNETLFELKLQSVRAELNARIAEYQQLSVQARLKFIKTLNIEQGTYISVTGSLSEKSMDNISLSKCLSWSDQFRPELKQTQFQEEIDALSVNLSMAERYPTVLFGASYEFNGNEFPLDSENWNATLSLNFPIFDGWAGWARVRQKRAQRNQGRYKQAQLTDEVHMEVRQAYSKYEFWKNQTAPRQKEYNISKGLLSSLQKIYRKGKVAPDEYLNALVKTAEIEGRYLEAVKEELVSLALLEKSMGKLLNGQ